MRVFLLTCLLATALAAPQGYNYQQQHKNSFSTGLQQGSAGSVSSTSHEGQHFLQQSLQNPKITQTLIGGGQNFIQRPQQNIIPQSFGVGRYTQPQGFQQAYNRPGQSVTKDIFVHVAPEEPEERYAPQPFPVAPPRKHYRIVFIKAPTPKISSSALRVQQAPTEEKTIIYVLTKKPDPLDLESAIQEAPQKPPSKPEVYFIKYKTQEEAQHAQRTIQAEYDKLGGSTQISDEGVAPVTSVIGSLDQPQAGPAGSHSLSTAGSSGGNGIGSGVGFSNENKYLPPISL